MREQLIAAVASRLRRFTSTDDPELIVSPEAHDEVNRLVATTADAGQDRQIGLLAGLFHWYRYRLSRTGHNDVDLTVALALLHDVYRTHPDAVPRPLHRFFEAPPPAGADEAGMWGQLSVLALEQALAHTDGRFLATAINAGRRAVTMAPDHPDLAMHLSNLCSALRWKFVATGDVEALDQAVSTGRQAVAAVPDGHPHQAMYLANLGTTQHERSGATGSLSDLADAVGSLRRAVAALGADHSDRPLYLSRLATSLRQWSERTGEPRLLDEAIGVTRAALADPRTPPTFRAEFEAGLGTALTTLAERTGDDAVLAEGIGYLRGAVATGDGDDRASAGRLSTLAGALGVQYERTGDPAVLDEAIEAGRAAVSATGDDHVHVPGRLANLGNALRLRFEATGELPFMEEALQHLRRAVAATPERHPDRAAFRSNLGDALRLLAERTGSLTALDEAARCLRDALPAIPAGHPHRTVVLANLATVRWQQFERTGETTTLREAIEVGRTAVTAIPAGHRFRTVALSNLGSALGAWFERTMDPAALDEALRHLREVVAATPADHANRAMYLSNLAVTLHRFSAQTRSPALLAEAVAVAREAVTATGADHPDRARHLLNLGFILLRRAQVTDDDVAGAEALATFRTAAASPTSPTSMRIDAAVQWARHSGDVGDALAGFTAAVELLPRLAGPHLHRDDSERWLARHAGLAQDAAACALRAGRPERAVTLLEQGRGVLLAQAIDGRGDLTELREQDPDLADRFTRLTVALDGGRDGSHPDPGTRRELAAELDQVVGRVRELPGLERFLLPPAISRLVAEADAGPVVMINVSADRCDALALTTDGIRAIPLPAITAGTVRERVDAFLAAVDTAHDPAATMLRRHRARQVINETLHWLWDAIAEPVLDGLGLTRSPAGDEDWPRVWWAPAGLLSLLPLHAAGYHGEPDGARTVLDRVVSSYTPTVRALAHARSRSPEPRRRPRPLVVAMSSTPGAADLPGAARETELLRAVFPDARVLANAEATRERVLSAMADQPWVHFACHGYSDPGHPSRSHLLVHDHADRPLDVLDVSRLRVADAELAYLSACHTARTTPALADEAIHIATAFQLAGYRHVVGTLWTVDDALAADIADQVYRQLAASTPHTAHAVHHAVRRVRDRYPNAASLWAAYIHAGP